MIFDREHRGYSPIVLGKRTEVTVIIPKPKKEYTDFRAGARKAEPV